MTPVDMDDSLHKSSQTHEESISEQRILRLKSDIKHELSDAWLTLFAALLVGSFLGYWCKGVWGSILGMVLMCIGWMGQNDPRKLRLYNELVYCLSDPVLNPVKFVNQVSDLCKWEDIHSIACYGETRESMWMCRYILENYKMMKGL